MAVKFLAMYGKPDDPDAFDRHYFDTHLPLTQQWPGVDRIEVTRGVANPMGGEPAYHLVFEAWFPDLGTLQQAMQSEPGRAAGEDYARIATPGSQLLITEVVEGG
jgi:uncharacterized protein (TIGR02118 family)